MRRQITLLFCFLLFTISARAQSTAGQIVHYTFNGNAADYSGNNNHGYPTSSVTLTAGRDGIPNTAYYFNGDPGCYISVPYSSTMNLSNFSIGAIVKPIAFNPLHNQGSYLFMRGKEFDPGSYGLIFNDAKGLPTDESDYDPNGFHFTSLAGSTFTVDTPAYTPTINLNQWYAVVITYDNGFARIYVDGVLKSTKAILGGSLGTSTAGMFIGRNYQPANLTEVYPFKGIIDDIIVYNRVIDDTDIIAYSKSLYIRPPFNDTFLCAGRTFPLQYVAKKQFNAGNTFIAQLSDASGHFDNAQTLNIGSLSSTGTGTINCFIPITTPVTSGYRVRVIATNPADTSFDNGKDIGIQGAYDVPTANSNTPVCEGGALQLSVTSNLTGTIYSWKGPGTVTAKGQNPVIGNVTMAHAGDYIVEAKYYGCPSYDTITVAIKPTPKLTTADTIVLCADSTIHLDVNNNLTGSTYLWEGVNGFKAYQKDTFIYNAFLPQQGAYWVKATYNGCTSPDDTTFVVINPRPTPKIISNSPICVGDTLIFNVDDTLAGASYTWKGPKSYNSAIRSAYLFNSQLDNSGNYIVTATSPLNCASKDSVYVTIKPLPEAPVLNSNSPVCSGDTLTLNALSASSNISYDWQGPNNFSASGQHISRPSVPYDGRGTYKSIVTMNGCTSEQTIDIAVNLRPDPPVASSNSPVKVGQELKLTATSATAGTYYKWTGPNGFYSQVQNPVIPKVSLASAGTYEVTAMLGGCTISAVTLVTITSDSHIDTFALFPNPNKGSFTLLGNTHTTLEMPLEIIDASGQVVFKETAQPVNNKLKAEINLEPMLPAGVYILRIRINGKVQKIPFSVVR